ncbi:MAG: methionyl-tRNA formyltransferase [Spirochaetes bacterium]|nr:methionyl-tRNA formyltransferase [Spirochaetota bacterium]
MTQPTRIVFWGSPAIAATFLEHLVQNFSHQYRVTAVVTQTEKTVQRQGKAAVRSAVHEKAEALGLPVFTPKSVKKEADELLKQLHVLGFDIFVVLAYGKILPLSVVEAPHLKSVNFHGSLLPLLRGASPIEHSILQGFHETGWTLQRIVEKLDAGDIIAHSRVAIAENDTTGSLYPKMTTNLIEHGVAMLDAYIAGAAALRAQDETAATHCGKISAEDGRLDFTNPANELRNRYRAFTPRPGVFAFFREKKIKLAFDLTTTPIAIHATPGALVRQNKCELYVACGDGQAMRIATLTPEGKKAMAATDFMNGYRLAEGDKLM